MLKPIICFIAIFISTSAPALGQLTLKKAERAKSSKVLRIRSLSDVAKIASAQGDLPKCEALWKKALVLADAAPSAEPVDILGIVFALAQTYVLEEKLADADALLKRGIAMDDKLITSQGAKISRLQKVAEDLNYLTVCYLQKGDNNSAEKSADEAIRLSPTYGMAYYNRAIVHYRLQNIKKAEEDTRNARQFGYAATPLQTDMSPRAPKCP